MPFATISNVEQSAPRTEPLRLLTTRREMGGDLNDDIDVGEVDGVVADLREGGVQSGAERP